MTKFILVIGLGFVLQIRFVTRLVSKTQYFYGGLFESGEGLCYIKAWWWGLIWARFGKVLKLSTLLFNLFKNFLFWPRLKTSSAKTVIMVVFLWTAFQSAQQSWFYYKYTTITKVSGHQSDEPYFGQPELKTCCNTIDSNVNMPFCHRKPSNHYEDV